MFQESFRISTRKHYLTMNSTYKADSARAKMVKTAKECSYVQDYEKISASVFCYHFVQNYGIPEIWDNSVLVHPSLIRAAHVCPSAIQKEHQFPFP